MDKCGQHSRNKVEYPDNLDRISHQVESKRPLGTGSGRPGGTRGSIWFNDSPERGVCISLSWLYFVYTAACDSYPDHTTLSPNRFFNNQITLTIIIMLDGKKSVLVINGPNLNLLGIREPHSESRLRWEYWHELTSSLRTRDLTGCRGSRKETSRSSWSQDRFLPIVSLRISIQCHNTVLN